MKWIDSFIETMNVFKQIFMHSVAYFNNYNKHTCWLTVILSSSNMSAHQITFRRVSLIYWFYAPQLNVEPRQLVKPVNEAYSAKHYLMSTHITTKVLY